jgi:hypothetical protein
VIIELRCIITASFDIGRYTILRGLRPDRAANLTIMRKQADVMARKPQGG